MAAGSAGTFAHLGQFLVLWLILEFLLYYARYQWNDVRGLDNDRVHPARHLRARLPAGYSDAERRRNVNASLAAACARVTIALLAGWALGVGESVAILATTVCLSAVLYESVRSLSTPGLRDAPGLAEVSAWLTVGLGYAIRLGLGLALAGIPLNSGTMAVGLAYGYAFGTMYVLLSWALEASNHCARSGSALTVDAEAGRKPHIAALITYLVPQRQHAVINPAPAPLSSPPGHLGSTAALAPCTALACPWNLAFVTTAPLAGLLGVGLAGSPIWPAGCAAALVSLSGGAGLLRSARSPFGWVVAVTLALALVAIGADSGTPWVAPLPWLAVAACYYKLRSSSYLRAMGGGGPAQSAGDGTGLGKAYFPRSARSDARQAPF